MYRYNPIERINCVAIALSLGLAMTGCSMFSDEAKLHKNAKGSVYLKEIADWSFEANHPATIDQATMLKILKGVIADDWTRSQAYSPASGSKPMRVFSDEDAEFLAPLLAQGLLQAKPEQMVGFKVSPSAGSGTEPTAGTLYVHQGSIHLTLASQDRRTAGFTPVSAARIEKTPPFIPLGRGATTMAIDYQAVAKMSALKSITVAGSSKTQSPSGLTAAPVISNVSAPAGTSASTPSQRDLLTPIPTTETDRLLDPTTAELASDELLNKKMDELREAREINKIKDSEISMLKKEVAWMKQELRERSAEINAMKANKVSRPSPPKKRTVEVSPQR